MSKPKYDYGDDNIERAEIAFWAQERGTKDEYGGEKKKKGADVW